MTQKGRNGMNTYVIIFTYLNGRASERSFWANSEDEAIEQFITWAAPFEVRGERYKIVSVTLK